MVHHVALSVVDLESAERFWSGVLGLQVARRSERSVWLDLGGGALLMLERVAGPEKAPVPFSPGWGLLALRIGRAERASWEERLRAAGVAVVHRTEFTLYAQDPEGNRVGLSHWPDAV